MSDIKQVVTEAEVAAQNEVKSVRAKVDAFIRANALKAISGSAIAGAVVGRFFL